MKDNETCGRDEKIATEAVILNGLANDSESCGSDVEKLEVRGVLNRLKETSDNKAEKLATEAGALVTDNEPGGFNVEKLVTDVAGTLSVIEPDNNAE